METNENAKKIKLNVQQRENVNCFEEINLGFVRGGEEVNHNSMCGPDADRFCSGLCPTAGCRHGGCCGSNFDWAGEPALSEG